MYIYTLGSSLEKKVCATADIGYRELFYLDKPIIGVFLNYVIDLSNFCCLIS